jgi:hypothetical protein
MNILPPSSELKHWHTAKILHGATTQIIVYIHSTEKTSNLRPVGRQEHGAWAM